MKVMEQGRPNILSTEGVEKVGKILRRGPFTLLSLLGRQDTCAEDPAGACSTLQRHWLGGGNLRSPAHSFIPSANTYEFIIPGGWYVACQDGRDGQLAPDVSWGARPIKKGETLRR